jgi:hypothetical protein
MIEKLKFLIKNLPAHPPFFFIYLPHNMIEKLKFLIKNLPAHPPFLQNIVAVFSISARDRVMRFIAFDSS